MTIQISSWISLAMGIIDVVACSITAYHITKTSKSTFALILLAFSFGFGFYEIVHNFVLLIYWFNFYALNVFKYFYYFCYLQAWFFSMKYLDSYIVSRLNSKFTL